MKNKNNVNEPDINWKFFAASVLVVIAGYVLLYLGSTRIAPVLIVLGYILTGFSLTPFKKGENKYGQGKDTEKRQES